MSLTAKEVKEAQVESFLNEFKGTRCPICKKSFMHEVKSPTGQIYYHCLTCDEVYYLDPIKGMTILRDN